MRLFELFPLFAVFASLYVGIYGQTWSVQNYYSDTTCRTLVGVQYTFGTGTCSSIGCTVSGSQSFEQFCSQSSIPALPPSWLVLRTFSTTGCGGIINNYVASATSVCLPIAGGTGSWQLSCSGSTLTRTIFNAAGCSGGSSPPLVTSGCTDSGTTSRNSQCPSTCTPSLVQPALAAATVPTDTIGFITTATVTFCTSASSQVFLSGDSTLAGGITVDDMIVYQLDSNAVVGLGFFSTDTCSASGFLSISSGSVVTAGISSHGPSFSLGTVSAGTHTLKIGTYNCVGAGASSLINLVGCSLVSCATTTTTTTPSGSATTAPSSTAATTCFHESTVISHGGRDWTLDQLLHANDHGNDAATPRHCSVPHVVKAIGVAVSIACVGEVVEKQLRLTNDHLVFTQSGLKHASDLIPGHDLLFSDLEQTKECRVVKVVPESVEQRYFGLNCLESIVLANGIKTSTFGRYHTVPAAWMKWVGSALGVDRASRWGDSVVEFLAKIHLL